MGTAGKIASWNIHKQHQVALNDCLRVQANDSTFIDGMNCTDDLATHFTWFGTPPQASLMPRPWTPCRDTLQTRRWRNTCAAPSCQVGQTFPEPASWQQRRTSKIDVYNYNCRNWFWITGWSVWLPQFSALALRIVLAAKPLSNPVQDVWSEENATKIGRHIQAPQLTTVLHTRQDQWFTHSLL